MNPIGKQAALEIALAKIEEQFGKPTIRGIKRYVASFTGEGQKVILGFGTGKFDDWCIYVLSRNKKWMRFPTDEWYFGIVKSWTEFWSPKNIYADFVKIYEVTTADCKPATVAPILELIKGLAWNYRDEFEAQIIFTILYMGMVAEENKDGAILKKRIKRLGMYQLLMEDMSPHEAAHFSRNKSTLELAPYCNERGF